VVSLERRRRAIDRGTFDRGRKVGEWIAFAPDGSVRKVTTHRG